ncbi:hypothetical protein EJB05_25236, partial [Eragrostis curvula]
MLLIAILFPSTHPSEEAAREEEAEARRRRRCPSGARQGYGIQSADELMLGVMADNDEDMSIAPRRLVELVDGDSAGGDAPPRTPSTGLDYVNARHALPDPRHRRLDVLLSRADRVRLPLPGKGTEFHPDVYKDSENEDLIMRRVIEAYQGCYHDNRTENIVRNIEMTQTVAASKVSELRRHF